MAQTQPSTAPSYLNVNEIFGPTIQGEGPHAGLQVGFLRLAGCNLSCSWCDTPYSWNWERFDKNEESKRMTIEEVISGIKAIGVQRLVITGGEPMLQQRKIPAVQAGTRCLIDVETNGTIAPHPDVIEAVDLFSVSPKLASGGDPKHARLKPDTLQAFSALAMEGKAIFKFVAQSQDDFAEIEEFIELGHIPASAVWIMPEGLTAESHMESMRRLADATIARRWNLTSRLHLLIWNTERGH